MLTDQCSGWHGPACLKTKAGLLCFTTVRGVVAIDPRNFTERAAPPRVLIEEALVDEEAGWPPRSAGSQAPARAEVQGGAGRSQGSTQPSGPMPSLRIPPGRHGVEFHYTGLGSLTPERIQFRRRLEGLEDWNSESS